MVREMVLVVGRATGMIRWDKMSAIRVDTWGVGSMFRADRPHTVDRLPIIKDRKRVRD